MKKVFSILALLAIVVGVINLPGMNLPVYAADTKTITVNFKSNPTPASVSVSKTPLKYNKGFAFSLTTDDSYIEGYNPVFRYLNGGYVTELGQTVEGLYSSDGTGYRVPFKGGFNWLSVNAAFADLHINTPGYMTWDNLREVYALGWEPINHGWTSMVTPIPSSTIINYPAPHGPSTIDYNYEITQNTAVLQTQLGATIKHFGLPAGDTNYTSAAWANGMKTIYTGQTNSANNNDGLMNAANTLNLNNLTIRRKYFADQTTLQEMKTYIDNIANTSTGGANFWGVASAHRVRTPVTPPDNGNLSFANFKNFMDYVSGKYGIKGNDSLWMASSPEVYEYLVTKQKTTVNTNLVGSVLTITLDHSLVDTDLRRYALSLAVSADAEIDSISYSSGFTHTSENKSTGLINLDWGFVSLSNDFTRAETLTAAAETSRTQATLDTARTYVNLLASGSTKDAFTTRLNNIVIKPKNWKVNFGNNGYTAGVWNEYGGNLASHSSLTLKDTDGNISSITVKIQQDFSSKSSTAGQTSTPANTGYFPDAYLQGMIRMYNASTNTTPGIVRLGGLDSSKQYELILMGSQSLVDAITDKTKTVYSVSGVSKELQTSQNTNNVVTYSNLSSDVNGNIDISVAKKYANWGYGVLNAFQLNETTENIAEYSITFDANGGIGDTGPTTMDYGTALTAPTVTKTGYNFTGWSPTVPATVGAGNATYTAQWVASQVNITFAANGGTGGTGPTSMQPGAVLTSPAVAKTGYVLSGWLPSVPATVPNVAATYTAQWTKTEIGLTKTESGFTVNIKGWNASDKYQIWSYQRITSDIFLNASTDVKANQWILSKAYILGSAGVVQGDNSINFTIDSFVSPDNNYTVAVRILDDSNKFVGVLMDNFTRTEVSEVEITKVLVDSAFSSGMEIKQIQTGANVLIKVIYNGLANTTYTAQVLETLATLNVSNTNEFVWDISGLLPRTYTIRVTIANDVSTSSKDILFRLYKVSGITYSEIGNMTLNTYDKIGTGNITITPNFNIGNNRYFYYKISEPERVTYLTSPSVTSNAAITQEIVKYGTYYIIGYANRQEIEPGFGFYDDGIIKRLIVKRNSTPDTVTLSADKTLNPIVKGEAIIFTGNASIDGLSGGETLQYSFWRYDAMGYALVKDWSTSNILNWTPNRVGVYNIEVRAKGSLAGSYEAASSVFVKVVNTGEELATVGSISIESLAAAVARVPIDIKASVSGASTEDILYKFYVTDTAMGTIQLQDYSSDSNCTWTPRKAGQYKISVLVKSRASFGKYDAIQVFDVTVS